ncbi:MAG TPA: Hpt domain-containing protein [Elusimicrobia bacterium]|nr:MAG: hypothetical protein A2X29_09350 [Elusimicrobia bacterium GWA2_64_40]OGR66454.1 MAG: hypothetical protein A2X30_04690 [Elusimicrobia bacterium GWB2_63_16]HAU90499.1 Hpt domain-containing protein [Elusimicrobiota bacterium]
MAAYRVSIDPDFRDLVPGYLEKKRGELPAFRAFLAARDLAALGAAGHKLVGAGGGYGFDRLTEIGRKLEDLSRAGDAQGLAGCLAELEDYLQNLEVVYE